MKRSTGGPAPLQVAEDIVPIAEFKAHLSELVRGLPGRRRPVVITQNGRPAAVVLSPAEYDRFAHAARFVGAVSEGLEDVDKGRVISDADVGKHLDRRYGPLRRARLRRK